MPYGKSINSTEFLDLILLFIVILLVLLKYYTIQILCNYFIIYANFYCIKHYTN